MIALCFLAPAFGVALTLQLIHSLVGSCEQRIHIAAIGLVATMKTNGSIWVGTNGLATSY
jgi:hypothetical protein